MVKINEIFFSIQGESTRVGLPTVFVRTSGCPLRCYYCDTAYAFTEGAKESLNEIIEKVNSYPTPYVCITGGEPLVQKDIFTLMTELCDLRKKVSVETSGAYSVQDVDSRVKKIVDVKTPDSGEGETFLLDNLEYLSKQDEVKFVITSEKDFEWSKDFINRYKLTDKLTVLISPSYEKIKYHWLAEKVLNELPNARFQAQLHKVIWPEADRAY